MSSINDLRVYLSEQPKYPKVDKTRGDHNILSFVTKSEDLAENLVSIFKLYKGCIAKNYSYSPLSGKYQLYVILYYPDLTEEIGRIVSSDGTIEFSLHKKVRSNYAFNFNSGA